MHRVLCTALLLALTVSVHAQDAQKPSEKGEAVSARAKADAARLLPQRGLGGSETNDIKPNGTKFSECRIEAEGCEKMKGFLSVPEDLEPGKKYALLFVFHGNGDRGEARTRVLSQVTTRRDPVFVIGVQYQELTEDGKGKMGLPTLAKPDKIIEGCKWLLAKTIKDQPIDTSRVFVGGFSWGTAWTSGWCNKEWRENPDAFPFRAAFLYSSGGQGTKESMPPIPVISTVGENELQAKGNYEVLPAVRHYSNVISAWGVPCQHHEIPGMGHDVNYRCLQITRDVINELGGPGAVPYASGPKAAPEPLPFEASDDPYVKEVTALCADDKWAEALKRIDAIDTDRKVKAKDKKAVKAFEKTLVDFAKKEMPRLDKLIAQEIKEEKMPGEFVLRRQRGLIEAFGAESWAKDRGFAQTLARINDDFPPVAREREREKLMRDALALERENGKRAEAKAVYEKLAARKDEDRGASIWPKAAAYRLQWWLDG